MAYSNRYRHRRPGNQPKEKDIILVRWYDDVYYVSEWNKNKTITREVLAEALSECDDPFETEEVALAEVEALLKRLKTGAEVRQIDIDDYPPELPAPVMEIGSENSPFVPKDQKVK